MDIEDKPIEDKLWEVWTNHCSEEAGCDDSELMSNLEDGWHLFFGAIEIKDLRDEVAFLRQYGNKDCTAMADEALAKHRAEKDAEDAKYG